MIVDCVTCPVRGRRCDSCVVTVLREPGSAERRLASPQQLASPQPLSSTELELDAAESSVVSMFVGVGLVNVGAVARLRARRESVQPWTAVGDVG